MKAKNLLLFLLVITITACRKQAEQPVLKSIISSDKPVLKLKDMIVNRLPSPYYHFDYNDSGYITKAAFASGLSFYHLTYTDKKVSEMAMNKDVPFDTKKDKMEYDYDHDNLTGIRVIDKNGVLYRKCLLTYFPSKQLQKLEWDVKVSNTAFATEMILEFSYYADGNLERIKYTSSPTNSQTLSHYEDKYENYDDKLNADGFSLLHINPYFLNLILLPSVHLQMNNPRHMTHTGDGDNYTIDYSYTYDAQARPLTKSGDFAYTNGTNAGLHVDLLTTFSYYD
ncbi:MAG: hypothetical protein ABIN91_11870 [Mucilaginibacter sp.]|uniref:hypothetical protein n=1 Tax=Mucilaginibacter sp. TaxID=1882438 RepID=UPI003267DA29